MRIEIRVGKHGRPITDKCPSNMHGLVEVHVHRGRHDHLLPTRALLIGTSPLPFYPTLILTFFGKGPKYFRIPIGLTGQHISTKFSVSSRRNKWTKTQAPRPLQHVNSTQLVNLDLYHSRHHLPAKPHRNCPLRHLLIHAHLHHPLRLACFAHIKYYIPFIPKL